MGLGYLTISKLAGLRPGIGIMLLLIGIVLKFSVVLSAEVDSYKLRCVTARHIKLSMLNMYSNRRLAAGHMI